MPELPEVENVVRTIRPKLVGKIFTQISFAHNIKLRQPLPENTHAERLLLGKKILHVSRRAKYIIFTIGQEHFSSEETSINESFYCYTKNYEVKNFDNTISDNIKSDIIKTNSIYSPTALMIVHLGMTGHLSLKNTWGAKHCHALFNFAANNFTSTEKDLASIALSYTDPRRFGCIKIISLEGNEFFGFKSNIVEVSKEKNKESAFYLKKEIGNFKFLPSKNTLSNYKKKEGKDKKNKINCIKSMETKASAKVIDIENIYSWDEILTANGCRNIGVEPLDPQLNLSEFLSINLHRYSPKMPIKLWLMQQARIVGIGNIYASEILHLAMIHPTRPSSSLGNEEISLLSSAIINILNFAIDSGGSTIQNYRNSDGKSGEFQNQLKVYGRNGEYCIRCSEEFLGKKSKKTKIIAEQLCLEKIQRCVMGGRSTYWCPKCQK